jgi:hypothetical protein
MPVRAPFLRTPLPQPDAPSAWPNLTQVEAAKDDASRLAIWSRTLPAADDRDQRDILQLIVAYLPSAVRQARQRSGVENS